MLGLGVMVRLGLVFGLEVMIMSGLVLGLVLG